MTVVRTCLPPTSFSTYVVEPEVCSARLGTASTLLTCLVMIETVADVPAYSLACAPVTVTVTGKVAAPDELASATRPTSVTVP